MWRSTLYLNDTSPTAVNLGSLAGWKTVPGLNDYQIFTYDSVCWEHGKAVLPKEGTYIGSTWLLPNPNNCIFLQLGVVLVRTRLYITFKLTMGGKKTQYTCVHTYITSKRIELEIPSCSDLEENLTNLNNLTNRDFLAQFVWKLCVYKLSLTIRLSALQRKFVTHVFLSTQLLNKVS